MESLPVEMRRMIMGHFSSTELLTISLVNKVFYNEARTLLRDRANLIVVLDCTNVLPFMSALEEMNLVPFSGIKIHWNEDQHRRLCPVPRIKLDPNSLAILDRAPWKSLSVKVNDGRYIPKSCPALQLVLKILQDSSGVLEQLELNNHNQFLQFLQQTIQDSLKTFPQLKSVKIEGESMQLYGDKDHTGETFVKAMLARTPNLQEFHFDNPSDLRNLDSLFCGIFPEEVAQLQEQDDEYLRTVHIVPVMPSLMCLRGSRTFKLTINHHYCRRHFGCKVAHPIVSKVTALIAFQRRPNLSINIRVPSDSVVEG